MRKLFLGLAMFFAVFAVKADEGMWILKELNGESAARMKELGFTFPIDSIYSEKNPSLKDAVVIFGGGCTGVAVSNQGLIFTNHHCGYDAIQKLSSVEHDYLKDGFASQSNEQELPAEGLKVAFLQKTEDITDYIMAGISENDAEEVRLQMADSLSNEYLKKYEGNNFIKAEVVPFYSNNKYYVVVYEVFNDVRLVFTPPSSVGKFGGETDNWMWPRHTGDFSVFRVYANKDNKATSYSPDNVPYTPKYFVPVSLKGYKENDYSMTIGFPGRTQRYIPSWGIDSKVESEHKPRIEVRGIKQEIWKKAMNADDAIRIKYASKYAGSSNYWKNAMGMNEAIANLNVIKGKQEIERNFTQWVNSNSSRTAKYGNVLSELENGYKSSMAIDAIGTYFMESFFMGIEATRIANTVVQVSKSEKITEKSSTLNTILENTFKDYEVALDKEVMPALLKLYRERVPAEYLPAFYTTIDKKFKGDYEKYAEWFYKTTKVTSTDGINALFAGKEKDILKDPAFDFANSIMDVYKRIIKEKEANSYKIAQGNRLYVAGLMEMNPEKAFSPDANFTQRLSYGSVKSYAPADAINFNYFSTPKGILEKQKPGDPEFNVQSYILDNIKSENWGQYADKDGIMHVNFLSNNDITGGNSGSPVFNGQAELIGLAFDGNWEALSGDIVFNTEVQRCINVDIRYVLYTIDKVMNCPRIIEELQLSK